ncbi:MAG: hypothetical protein WCT39_07105 [Candidatus Margulisiibacteriota bacterium]
MNNLAQNKRPSDLLIEKVLLGEANPEEIKTYEEWLKHDPQAMETIENKKAKAVLDINGIETWDKFKNRHVVYSNHKRVFSLKELICFLLAPKSIRLAGITVSIVLIMGFYMTRSFWQKQGYESKGGAQFSFMVKRGNSVFKGYNGMNCCQGDTLQFYLMSFESVYYAILYKDDNKRIAAYFPKQGTLKYTGAQEKGELAQSIVLDSAWSFQKIYTVVAKNPFDVKEIVDAIESFSGLKGTHFQTFDLKRIQCSGE